jgi:hypothetical protein
MPLHSIIFRAGESGTARRFQPQSKIAHFGGQRVFPEIRLIMKLDSKSKATLALQKSVAAIVGIKLLRFVALAFFFAFGVGNSSAQVYQYIVGYWSAGFVTGSNLFNNPLQSGSNALHQLFPYSSYAPIPEGTAISLWNSTNSSFYSASTFTNHAWSVDLILPPGTGVLVYAPSPFTNTINGYVLDHNGSGLTNQFLTLPPVFSVSNGVYLLGDKAPIVNVGTNIFLSIFGRMPFVGEKITQFSGTSTYLGNGIWDTIPTLGISKAAFFTIISEPPPVLTIVNKNNQAIVSWPSEVSGWTLQTNNNLGINVWGNYAGAVVNNTVTNSTLSGIIFFRLSHP